jgi:hypothetical protein
MGPIDESLAWWLSSVVVLALTVALVHHSFKAETSGYPGPTETKREAALCTESKGAAQEKLDARLHSWRVSSGPGQRAAKRPLIRPCTASVVRRWSLARRSTGVARQ